MSFSPLVAVACPDYVDLLGGVPGNEPLALEHLLNAHHARLELSRETVELSRMIASHASDLAPQHERVYEAAARYDAAYHAILPHLESSTLKSRAPLIFTWWVKLFDHGVEQRDTSALFEASASAVCVATAALNSPSDDHVATALNALSRLRRESLPRVPLRHGVRESPLLCDSLALALEHSLRGARRFTRMRARCDTYVCDQGDHDKLKVARCLAGARASFAAVACYDEAESVLPSLTMHSDAPLEHARSAASAEAYHYLSQAALHARHIGVALACGRIAAAKRGAAPRVVLHAQMMERDTKGGAYGADGAVVPDDVVVTLAARSTAFAVADGDKRVAHVRLPLFEGPALAAYALGDDDPGVVDEALDIELGPLHDAEQEEEEEEVSLPSDP